MSVCSACSTSLVDPGLDLGTLPLSHDLCVLPDRDHRSARKIPFHLVQCPSCALVQTLDSPTPASVVPRAGWIKFTEPELHLDDLIEKIIALPNISPDSNFGGLSSKDDSILERFSTKGFRKNWRIDPERDVGFLGNSAGVAWIQEAFNEPLAARLRAERGRSDVLIARHFLEHVPHIESFAAAARELLNPGGFLVLEVPDCGAGFEIGDVSILWEEHHICFTAATLERALMLSGFDVVFSHEYEFPNETCLVAVATPKPAPSPDADHLLTATKAEFERFASFVSNFPNRRQRLRGLLEAWRAHGPIALYGAGHHTNTFINALGVGDLIAMVVDDNPHKTGKFLPCSDIPVVPSENLKFGEVAACLSSLGFAAEQRMLLANAAFIGAGGSFYSIFPERADTPLRWLAGPKMPSLL